MVCYCCPVIKPNWSISKNLNKILNVLSGYQFEALWTARQKNRQNKRQMDRIEKQIGKFLFH